MAKLTSKKRDNLSSSSFVFPKDRRYPIHDLAHAKNALARSSGKPEEAKVRAAVYKRYPDLKKHAEEHDDAGKYDMDCASCRSDAADTLNVGSTDEDEPDEDELEEGLDEKEEMQLKVKKSSRNGGPVDAKTLTADAAYDAEDDEDDAEDDEDDAEDEKPKAKKKMKKDASASEQEDDEEDADDVEEDEEDEKPKAKKKMKKDSALSAPVLHIDAPMNVDGDAHVGENGWLHATAMLTRTGIFEYKNSDGTTRRELRLPEEVFNRDSLKSMEMLPLTAVGMNGHPPEPLDGRNTKMYQVGQIGENIKKEGDFVKAKILVTDSEVVKEILDGKRNQVSVGYWAQTEEKPGTWKGLKYDSIQRNIKANHVALTSKARGGFDLKVRLDSSVPTVVSVEYLDTGATQVTNKFKLDGVEYEVSEPVAQALTKLTARADSAEAEVKKLTALTTPEAVQARVTARVALEKRASEVLGSKFKLDGLSDQDVKVAVIEKLDGDKITNKDPVYVDARYDGAIAHSSAFANRGIQVPANGFKADGEIPSAADARARMLKNQESMFMNAPKETK